MNQFKKVILIASIGALLGCNEAPSSNNVVEKSEQTIIQPATQKDIDNIAENLIVKYELISNAHKEKCKKDIE